MKFLSGIIMIIIVFTASCYYDSEEVLYPVMSGSCDTTNVTYSGTIVPILQSNCLSCHSNANAQLNGNNIKLESYADVYARRATVLTSVNHTGSSSPMPKGGPKLRNCLLQQINIWINSGAPSN